jgi:hypothetical protein
MVDYLVDNDWLYCTIQKELAKQLKRRTKETA